MRNIVLLFSALILGTSGIMASSTMEGKVATRNAYRYNNSFIFVEGGITFSVFPDGEFDFYIENYVNGRRNKITFNSGYDYSPYAQYDDYGAVIQVENVPIYYDYYGRVTQIGDVDIAYRNGRVFRMGGMYVYYNHNGYYDYHTGYINVYNRYYVYSPFHGFFLRPAIGFCLVLNRPYRRYYTPYRYTYYRPYRNNYRRTYAKIGKEHRYNQVRRNRATIYRNDKRVAVRENNTRRNDVPHSNRGVEKRQNDRRNNRSTTRGKGVSHNNNTTRRSSEQPNRTNGKVGNGTSVDRSGHIERRSVTKRDVKTANGKTVTKRSTTVRSPRTNTVTKRTVTQTPKSRTVTRSTKTYRKPEVRTGNRSVSKAPSKSRTTVSRSSSSPSRASKVSSRSVRSNTRSATNNSSRRH